MREASAAHLGESPVQYIYLSEFSNNDVGGLQVAMNDSNIVCVSDGLTYLYKDIK